MSIIVKGMKIPENCWECTGVELNVGVSVFGGMCPFCEKIRTDHDMKTGRHPDCPLIALQDKHGRLVDADALFREMEKASWYNNADRDEVAEELVLNATTIVEAEDSE